MENVKIENGLVSFSVDGLGDEELYHKLNYLSIVLEKTKKFSELDGVVKKLKHEKCPNSKWNSDNELFFKDKRISCAIMIYIDGEAVCIYRDQSIYLENSDIPQVNLNLIDAAIASRPFLPGGEGYGILGKIENLRGKFNLYKDVKYKLSIDKQFIAKESNSTTSEECYMLRGKLFINNISNDLKNMILKSKEVMLTTSKV